MAEQEKVAPSHFKIHFRELAFQKTDPENPIVPIGDPIVLKRGEDVPDWVTPSVVSALVNAGMIIPVAAPPVFEPLPDAGALPNPEVLPQVANAGAGVPPATPEVPSDPVVVDRPKSGDPKPMWEAYAEFIGIPREEAESLSKTALQARVAERETEREREAAGATPTA